MEQQVTEELSKVNLEKAVAVQEENLPVTFRVTAIEAADDTVGYSEVAFNEDYVNLSPATVAVDLTYLAKSNSGTNLFLNYKCWLNTTMIIDIKKFREYYCNISNSEYILDRGDFYERGTI